MVLPSQSHQEANLIQVERISSKATPSLALVEMSVDTGKTVDPAALQ